MCISSSFVNIEMVTNRDVSLDQWIAKDMPDKILLCKQPIICRFDLNSLLLTKISQIDFSIFITFTLFYYFAYYIYALFS